MASKTKFKTTMGANLYSLLSIKEGTSTKSHVPTIFRGNAVYEYDLDPNFGSDLPKIIMKMQSESQNEDTRKIYSVSDNLIDRISNILNTKKDSEGLFKVPESSKNSKRASSIQLGAEIIEEEEDIFSDVGKNIKPSETKIDIEKKQEDDLESFFENIQQERLTTQKIKIEKRDIFKGIAPSKKDQPIEEKKEDLLKQTLETIKKSSDSKTEAEKKLGPKLGGLENNYDECFPRIGKTEMRTIKKVHMEEEEEKDGNDQTTAAEAMKDENEGKEDLMKDLEESEGMYPKAMESVFEGSKKGKIKRLEKEKLKSANE